MTFSVLVLNIFIEVPVGTIIKNFNGDFIAQNIKLTEEAIFNGLEPIHKLKDGGYFKYYFSKSKSYKQIQKEKRKAKKKGFNSAFIVAFKGDKQIKLSEALDK